MRKYTGFCYPLQCQGALAGLHQEQQGFLCVKAQASNRLIYPQGKVTPDAAGQWTVDRIYGIAWLQL